MTFSVTQKSIASFVAAILISVQLLTVGAALLVPKPAQALFGIGDITFSTIIGNVYETFKDAGLAALKQVAVRAANTYLTRFIDKLQDKYKIKNFLYYDQILTNYYLSGYIRDKIADPDLRQIYSLMEANFITGEYTGLSGGIDPNKAVIPRLKAKIHDYYIKSGGIPTDYVTNPPANISNSDYFDAVSLWAMNPESATEQAIAAQFVQIQNRSSTAAQLEVIVGNSMKAGRILSGSCAPGPDTQAGISMNQFTIQETCEAVGGTWRPSNLNQVRDFIQNPTNVISSLLDKAIARITDNQFDPNNYAAAVGSLMGDYLFNKLASLGQDTITEYPDTFSPDNGTGSFVQISTAIDIDADGLVDGYDNDGDNVADICVYGSQNKNSFPPCLTSGEVNDTTQNNPDDGGNGGPIGQGGECGVYGMVFEDTNGNGSRDANEFGVAGQNIMLQTSDGSSTLSTAGTDGSGNYSFGLNPGSYRVSYVIPGGYTRTTDNGVAFTVCPSFYHNFGIQPL